MSEKDTDPRENEHHPRLVQTVIGHGDAERQLLDAYRSGRFHHAFMLAGPRGIGKATLAYALARFVLANGDGRAVAKSTARLEVPADNPVARRIAARGHADLLVIEKVFDAKAGRLKGEISVDQGNRAGAFFARTAGEGGYRVCIVDAADELNLAASNSLLKILEEPPEKALFLLVCHSPGRLLATIRSRCVQLTLDRLGEKEVRQIVGQHAGVEFSGGGQNELFLKLANGSAGRALELLASKGAERFLEFFKMANGPLDEAKCLAIAGGLQSRAIAAHQDFVVFTELLSEWIGGRALDAARAGLPVARCWVQLHESFAARLEKTNTYNLDRGQCVYETFMAIKSCAAVAHGS